MKGNVHQNQPVLQVGDSSDQTDRVVILVHGRGATAESMVSLAEALPGNGTRFLIPQAAGNRWYPQTAFGPLEPNEPDLSSGLEVIDDLLSELLSEGFSKEQIVLGGFSQGACLAAEYITRNPDRFGGLFVLSGALIGPPEMKRNPSGDLGRTPVFIGGSDVDPWVRKELFLEAERIFSSLNAEVKLKIYPGMGHVINEDELEIVSKIIAVI
jgi:predicted esterase